MTRPTDRPTLLVLALCALAAGCTGSKPEPVPAASIEQARAVASAYRQELVTELATALDGGDAAAAIRVCREAAPAIAARHSTGGVRVGRTSHRLRNPANVAPAWAEPLLAEYVAEPSTAEPRAVRLADGAVGYVEPLRTMSFCLGCHGPAIEPGLAATIGALYPDDRATGFRDGDLRGLVWVELPPGSAAPADS